MILFVPLKQFGLDAFYSKDGLHSKILITYFFSAINGKAKLRETPSRQTSGFDIRMNRLTKIPKEKIPFPVLSKSFSLATKGLEEPHEDR